jgi:hypothetical protein
VPDRDAELLEVLIAQIAEDRHVNIVLGEPLDVLGHAELFEPLRNLLQCGLPAKFSIGYGRELPPPKIALARPRGMASIGRRVTRRLTPLGSIAPKVGKQTDCPRSFVCPRQ